MVDIAVSVGSKVAEYLVAPVGRHCGYLIFSNSHVSQLNDEVQNLGDARDEVQHSIDEAKNNMKPIETKVEKWVKEVETVTNKARAVLRYNTSAKKTCFYGWLPNPKARYRLGREASKTVKDIRALIPRGKFEKVHYESPPTGLVTSTPEVNSSASDRGGTITDSRASIFEGIMKALDDEKLKVIGVYGAGGVGKTTLLKEVEKKLRKEGKPFHTIAKSTVSNIPDLKKIQDDIAYAFGLDLKNEPSEVGRRDLLSRRLKDDLTKKVLIILDDLWDKLDLEAVGIPSGDESTKCKLLLASRDRSVLEQKMNADETFRLEGLTNEEAFRLFEKTYGDELKDAEGLKAKAAQVVAKLAGLPLLIKSVASTLKYGGESTWDNALIKIEDSNIKAIVEWSYGHLEREETKSLFLLCDFIGGSIRVELLLGLGMGLGLYEGFDMTIRSSRNKLNEMLRSLRSICLLQDGGDDKENVTIHDLYSEEVISTPLTGQNSLMTYRNAGSWPKEKLEKCWVYLVNVGSDRLAELRLHWCPDFKIFMLSEHGIGECDTLDFTYMKELRVLYIGSMDFTGLPSSIKILENLQSLYLDKCKVEDVAILGKLKALQILSFEGSSISSLPQEIGKLTKLKLLNLTDCYELWEIEPGALGGLINLEELRMQQSFDEWMAEDEISSESCDSKLVELKSLTKLTTLEISIPDPTVLLEDGDLPFGNLIRFWINIGDARGREFEGLTTMKLKLEGCDSILSKRWVHKTLQKTQYLHLDGLREFKKSAYELCSRGFPELKHLEIQNCSSIKHIVSSSNGAFPLLESLFLENLTNLEKICDGPKCFSKLKAMRVTKCDRLEYFWCLSQMHRLAHMEEIKVCRCDSMRAIAIDEAGKDIVVVDDRVELPNVHRLELVELPKMTSFCIRAGITSEGDPIQVWFPHLESLVMVGLRDLEKILYGQPLLEYNNLKSIEIRKSQSTSSILKSDWILKLLNLESLQIRSSPSAEAIFDLEELKVMEHVVILSRLATLELSQLSNLRHMLKEDVKLQGISIFRNLKKLMVRDTGLTFLFPVFVAKCLREIRYIAVFDCENMEAVVVDEDGRDEGTNDIIEFPLLKRLVIIDCPVKKFISYPHGKKEAITATLDSQYAYSDSFFVQKVSLPSLKKLHLVSVGSFKSIWPYVLPQSSFDNLADLYISNCSELLNVFPSSITGRLHNLRIVRIKNCPSLESVFECRSRDSNTEQTKVLLPHLASVYIECCPSLESVFDCGSLTEDKNVLLPKLERVDVSLAGVLRHVVKSNSQTVLRFPSLKEVSVNGCFELRYLFPYGTATTLEKLESLRIVDCEQMKEVVAKKEGGRSKADVLSFSFLTSLIIFRCPNLGAFIPNPTSVERSSGETVKENHESRQPLFNEMVTFPTLSKIHIGGVQVKDLWNNQIPSDSFCELRYLQLMDCDNLQHIAPSHVWQRLQHCLVILEVTSCHSIEIIYESGATIVETGQLRSLILHDLENLRHIWRYNSVTNMNVLFPNLRDIEILRCPRLRMLFETFTTSFLEQIKWLQVESCDDMELIADHGECEEATCTTITFSELRGLKLKELPKFKRYLPEKYHVKFPSRAYLIRVGCGKEPDQYDPPFLVDRAQDPLQPRIRLNGWLLPQ